MLIVIVSLIGVLISPRIDVTPIGHRLSTPPLEPAASYIGDLQGLSIDHERSAQPESTDEPDLPVQHAVDDEQSVPGNRQDIIRFLRDSLESFEARQDIPALGSAIAQLRAALEEYEREDENAREAEDLAAENASSIEAERPAIREKIAELFRRFILARQNRNFAPEAGPSSDALPVGLTSEVDLSAKLTGDPEQSGHARSSSDISQAFHEALMAFCALLTEGLDQSMHACDELLNFHIDVRDSRTTAIPGQGPTEAPIIGNYLLPNRYPSDVRQAESSDTATSMSSRTRPETSPRSDGPSADTGSQVQQIVGPGAEAAAIQQPTPASVESSPLLTLNDRPLPPVPLANTQIANSGTRAPAAQHLSPVAKLDQLLEPMSVAGSRWDGNHVAESSLSAAALGQNLQPARLGSFNQGNDGVLHTRQTNVLSSSQRMSGFPQGTWIPRPMVSQTVH